MTDRALRGAAEGRDALSDVVEMLLDRAREIVEQFVERVEIGPAHIPVGLLGLRIKIAQVGERLVENRGNLRADFGGEIIFGREHE